MTLLTPTRVSHRNLTWCPDSKLFVGEISEIPGGFSRVYDDSVDFGVTVVGKTGREVIFVVENEVRDNEGDIMFWELNAVRPSDRELGVGLQIFND